MWAPWYNAPFVQGFTRFWKKYVRFDGRASQSEYWYWVLWFAIASVVLGIVGGIIDVVLPGDADVSNLFGRLWGLACALGYIALTVRRLHDVNLSGWFALFFVIPPLGILFSLVIGCLGTNPQGQRFDRPTVAGYGS
ncbi:hypothetical protein BIU97_10125 [Curtobacterium sp. MCBA15_009]|nr:hypothetical protein BIU92_10435 [Curtobacterium sp. MCBA15_003]OII10731.1 hypothetical protein BIU97_10125 [Curtobacterium sp. MCBA15_009]OII30334.1 hypothetical protein BIU94_11165 [Curtobacterium sp. MMLR14_006]